METCDLCPAPYQYTAILRDGSVLRLCGHHHAQHCESIRSQDGLTAARWETAAISILAKYGSAR
jgi:hypothetical protein